jgi:hypothetical protein
MRNRNRNRRRNTVPPIKVSISEAEIMADLRYPVSARDRPAAARSLGRKTRR